MWGNFDIDFDRYTTTLLYISQRKFPLMRCSSKCWFCTCANEITGFQWQKEEVLAIFTTTPQFVTAQTPGDRPSCNPAEQDTKQSHSAGMNWQRVAAEEVSILMGSQGSHQADKISWCPQGPSNSSLSWKWKSKLIFRNITAGHLVYSYLSAKSLVNGGQNKFFVNQR